MVKGRCCNMKPLKIAMMSMTHGHTRKYYQTLKDNPKLDWVAVATAMINTVTKMTEQATKAMSCSLFIIFAYPDK